MFKKGYYGYKTSSFYNRTDGEHLYKLLLKNPNGVQDENTANDFVTGSFSTNS